METIAKEVREYVTKEGKKPFRDWILSLKDKRATAKIYNRLDKVERGTLGHTRPVGKGVHELKIDGAGYRVYYANDGKTVILLLCGGDKRTQDKDIKNAQIYWKDYKER